MAVFGNDEKDISWQYEGRTKTGALVSGTVEAPTAIIARVKLRKKDIAPISIKPRTAFSGLTNLWGSLRSKSSNSSNTPEKRVRRFTGLARSREIHRLVQGQEIDAKNKKRRKDL